MEQKKSLSDQLEERLIEFAARIVTFSTELGGTPAGKHIAIQILRSGTAPAPNYAEARGAESRADFVHKLGIVQKELNETSVLATNPFENCRGKARKHCRGSRGKP
jgi:four helix bundle protein